VSKDLQGVRNGVEIWTCEEVENRSQVLKAEWGSRIFCRKSGVRFGIRIFGIWRSQESKSKENKVQNSEWESELYGFCFDSVFPADNVFVRFCKVPGVPIQRGGGRFIPQKFWLHPPNNLAAYSVRFIVSQTTFYIVNFNFLCSASEVKKFHFFGRRHFGEASLSGNSKFGQNSCRTNNFLLCEFQPPMLSSSKVSFWGFLLPKDPKFS